MNVTSIEYVGRHRDPSPDALSRGGAAAFRKALGVGLMYRGRHRDNTPEAHQRNAQARAPAELEAVTTS